MIVIEKIARELAAINNRDPDTAWPEYEDSAKRLISVITIPSPEMIAAAWDVIDQSKKSHRLRRLGPGAGPVDIFKAMLRA